MLVTIDIPDGAMNMLITGSTGDGGGFIISASEKSIAKFRRESDADRVTRYADAIAAIVKEDCSYDHEPRKEEKVVEQFRAEGKLKEQGDGKDTDSDSDM